MSTEYTWQPKAPCGECGRHFTEEELSIGTSAFGWCFSLRIYPDRGLTSLALWQDKWNEPGSVIFDEYGKQVTPAEMFSIITERTHKRTWNEARKKIPMGYLSWSEFHSRNESVEGPNGLLRSRIGRYCVGHPEGTFDLVVC